MKQRRNFTKGKDRQVTMTVTVWWWQWPTRRLFHTQCDSLETAVLFTLYSTTRSQYEKERTVEDRRESHVSQPLHRSILRELNMVTQSWVHILKANRKLSDYLYFLFPTHFDREKHSTSQKKKSMAFSIVFKFDALRTTLSRRRQFFGGNETSKYIAILQWNTGLFI